MSMILPPAVECSIEIPRGEYGAAELVEITEVCERSMWAMYDAMRGAVTGQAKTAPGRRVRG